MSAHTPGPWFRNIRANGKYPVVFAGRNQHVATVCQQKDSAETEANIDLIAAAPDLLAALHEIADIDTCLHGLPDKAADRCIEYAKAMLRIGDCARAAIAKVSQS